MKVLITGGEGFIGSHLAEKLKRTGNQIELFDLASGKDLRDRNSVDASVEGKDYVFHLAAVADLNWARENPLETMDINIGGTINIANSCAKYKVPLYHASTCCVYGNQQRHPVNEATLPNPAEIYACSKLAGEEIIRGYGLMYGLKFNLMRFATIYGPGMRPALGVYVFFKQALSGSPITIHGNGKQTRTLTYIDDLISGIVALFESGLFIGSVNLSTEEEISANQMAKMIKKLTNSKSKITHIDQRPGQTYRESVDSSKAKNLFGWEAKTTFREGLIKTFRWLTH